MLDLLIAQGTTFGHSLQTPLDAPVIGDHIPIRVKGIASVQGDLYAGLHVPVDSRVRYGRPIHIHNRDADGFTVRKGSV